MSARYRPTGVIPACLMPFDGELRIDEAAYRSHLRDLAGVDGVTAITINGHAAEVHALTFDEQRRALEVAMDELQGAVPVIVGVSSTGSQEAARLAAMAAEGGASGLLVFPPESMSMGGQLRPEMAMAHYGRIVDATDLPLILFQYPLPGGLGYPLQTMLSLCQKYPTIRGIKDWCNDPALHERHIRELHALENPVAVLSTHSAWLLGSLVMGCDGLLSGAGSVVANLQVALFRAVQADDLATARRLSDRLYPITRAFYGAPFLDMHNRMKEALVMLGRLPAAHVRPPLMKLSADEIQSIRRFLEQAEITPATVYQPVT